MGSGLLPRQQGVRLYDRLQTYHRRWYGAVSGHAESKSLPANVSRRRKGQGAAQRAHAGPTMTNLASVNDIPEALPTEWRFPLPHYYAKLIATARDCRYTDPLKPYGQDPRPPAPGQIRDSARSQGGDGERRFVPLSC